MNERYGVDRAGLAALLGNVPRYRTDQVWQGLYANLATPEEMTNLPLTLRRRLEVELPPSLAPVAESVSDRGDTIKFLWALAGGARIETVLMLSPGRATVCVSSQAGCAMGCGFCATGQAGFTRHLSTAEIVEQVVRARRAGPVTAGAARATSCSWGWASRSPTSSRCGARSSGSTTTSASPPAASRCQRSASCPASAASPSAACL